MNKYMVWAAATAVAGWAHGATIDFNELEPGAAGYYRPTTHGAHDWRSDGAQFGMNVATNAWGSSWGGFTYSDVNNPTESGYLNEYAVYGDGMDYSDGGVYAIGYVNSYSGGSAPTLTFDSAQTVNGLYVNNTAYTALDMISGSGFSKAFTTNDWFKLSIEGKNSEGATQGAVDYLLADFTGYIAGDDKDNYIVNEWTYVDLTALGTDVSSLTFSLSSSDTGTWGMNTPAYFAVDQIDVVPEPGTLGLILGGFGALLVYRRKRVYFLR
jgi:hypothetical protein